MGNSRIKNPRKIFSQPGDSGTDPSVLTRITNLENNYYKITYFANINGTSGTITPPTGATILLDQFFGGIDAYVSTISNGQPTGDFPKTAGGVTVDVSSFDALGNYTLTGTPSAFPVALIYKFKIKAIDLSNVQVSNELDMEDVNGLSKTLTSTHIFVGDTNNVATDVAVSGDATINNSGALTLASIISSATKGSASKTITLTVDAKGRVTVITDQDISITSTQVSDFVEAAQDAVGNILTDSTTIDFTYNDVANTITAIVIDGSITNTKLANMATQTFKGRTTTGTGSPEDLTKSQAQGILGLPSTSVDNQIVRFDGTGGNYQGSSLIIDDNGGIVTPGVAGSTFTAKKIEYDNNINQWILYDNDSNTALNVGYETWFICQNNTGSTIPNGSVVYINGSSGGVHTIALAKADAGTTAVGIGITTEDIANNATGKVTQSGLVNGVNTSGLSAGAVYVSSTVAGGLTNTAPTSPNYRMRVGFVGVISSTVGTILVTPSTAALGNGIVGQVNMINANGNQEYKTALTIGKGLQIINRNFL